MCVVFALIHAESRQRKDKLKSRRGTALFIGTRTTQKFYKTLDLVNRSVNSYRLQNLRFEDAMTVEHEYVLQLLESTFQGSAHTLPAHISVFSMLSVVKDHLRNQ